jgi:hypothetical protein
MALLSGVFTSCVRPKAAGFENFKFQTTVRRLKKCNVSLPFKRLFWRGISNNTFLACFTALPESFVKAGRRMFGRLRARDRPYSSPLSVHRDVRFDLSTYEARTTKTDNYDQQFTPSDATLTKMW